MVTKYDHDVNGFVTDISTTKNNKRLSSMKITVDRMGKYASAVSYDSAGKLDVYYDEITTNDFGEVTGAKGVPVKPNCSRNKSSNVTRGSIDN